MRLLLIIFISFSLYNCKNKIKNDCLPASLIQKLDSFKFELADSLSIEKKQIKLVDILVEKASKRKRVSFNLIEFDSLEIKSLINCYSGDKNLFSDSNQIVWQIANPYSNNLDLYLLRDSDLESDYLTLFWLYHLIDKSIVTNTFLIKNDQEIYLNGRLLNNFNEIRNLLVLRNPKIKDFDKRAVLSIIADKDLVSMDVIDKIENELREADVLRINYSTLSK